MPTPPPETSPTSRFQEKQDAVLAAAARHFNAQGVKGATLGGIAASVGLVTTSVTYYYRKKEDLATACFLRAIAAHEALARQAAGAGTVAERLSAFVQGLAGMVAGIETGARPTLILFNDLRALPQPQEAEVFGAYTDMFRRVRALFMGPETAAWSRADLNARTHLLVSTAHWMRAWLPRFEPERAPVGATRVTELLLRGLGGAARAWQDPPAGDQAALLGSGDATEEAFLRAATELVNEQGYRGASVDRISARLNLTKGWFYHHNHNKCDVIAACFERSFSVVRRALAEAEAAGGSGWQRAARAAAAVLCFQLSGQGPLLRGSATSALPDPAQRERVSLDTQRLTERLASLLVDGMVDGSVRPLDPGMAAQLLLAQLNAASELRRWVPSARAENVVGLYLRPALCGLLCEA
ncbi:TetR family transcriptional regulator [Aquabacterium sp. A7-Y]|uniref:TetR/AcrR family transcriptional regulator n=1 Tax=Aquabacterium sp. A7-Y TaxID=1349605 RepID=UPI00223D4D28|nr:TetR/AcrR family transcriptional regulator [Aquabacterium sp. A7-Y]MCW7536955.1 TetR family transcriptional regulator [Aquabacterium sp. A7-Y]